MDKRCAVCKRKFTAKRATAKYCGETCRKRAQRGGERPAEADASPDPAPADPDGDLRVGLLAATVSELVKAGRENSPTGQAAILLAYRLERAQADTGSSVAAMVKQHQATLAEALKSADKASIVDSLKKRRDAKRAG